MATDSKPPTTVIKNHDHIRSNQRKLESAIDSDWEDNGTGPLSFSRIDCPQNKPSRPSLISVMVQETAAKPNTSGEPTTDNNNDSTVLLEELLGGGGGSDVKCFPRGLDSLWAPTVPKRPLHWYILCATHTHRRLTIAGMLFLTFIDGLICSYHLFTDELSYSEPQLYNRNLVYRMHLKDSRLFV